MNVAEFDFELPDDLVAQEPPPVRGQSRLLVLDRATGAVEHTQFTRLGDYLRPGDLLVLNDTRVFPARLLGRRVPTGGAVECLLIRQISALESGVDVATPRSQLPRPDVQLPSVDDEPRVESGGVGRESFQLWEALMHPGQKLKPGARVEFAGEGVRVGGEVLARHFHGRRTIRLWVEAGPRDLAAAIDRLGHVPLPPYIRRADQPVDRERYQTVYARERGSVAAPTAGLHFTRELLDELAARGVQCTTITLHVGYGTFKPVRVERVEDHVVDAERFSVLAAAADAISRARREGRRVIAVGTTTTRALESLAMNPDGTVSPASGETRLFIRPGHEFRVVQGLVTNFHLPKSSLLILVAAFAGRERVLAAYREAVERRYRFYSYGDAMLIV